MFITAMETNDVAVKIVKFPFRMFVIFVCRFYLSGKRRRGFYFVKLKMVGLSSTNTSNTFFDIVPLIQQYFRAPFTRKFTEYQTSEYMHPIILLAIIAKSNTNNNTVSRNSITRLAIGSQVKSSLI